MSRKARIAFVERVRRSLVLLPNDTLNPSEYVSALEEIQADLDGMYEAAIEERQNKKETK